MQYIIIQYTCIKIEKYNIIQYNMPNACSSTVNVDEIPDKINALTML